MNFTLSSPSAVQECIAGLRSFGDGGNRAQSLVSGKDEQNVPVSGMRVRGWNSGVLIPTVSRLSLNEVTIADERPRNFATQLAHEECCRNRPSMACTGVGGWAATVKSKRGGSSMQSCRDLGFQFSGLVRKYTSTSAITRSDCYSTNGHPSSQASWLRSGISEQPQLLSLRCESMNKTGCWLSTKLNERLATQFDGSRFLGSIIRRDPGNSQIETLSALGFPRKKCRASLVCSAILSKSPDIKPDEQHESDREAKPQISVATNSEAPDSVVPDDIQPEVVHGSGGKSGFISFHRPGREQQEPETSIATTKSWRTVFWLLGPLVLTASVFLPPLYLRKIFGKVLSDSLMTDFVILIFTETLFFVGASVFLYIAHQFRTEVGSVSTSERRPATSLPFGYRLSSILSLGIGLVLPVATFSMVWPWTGPAAAAALAPYMVGLLVQLSLEQIARVKKSPVWPLVPITFQMYRLHQLNRAAQLISGLMFSLKGVEATAETMAISGSLQTLLFVLKILGVVSLASLGAFLTHQLPTQPPAFSSIASLP